jgi:hypothetical protein
VAKGSAFGKEKSIEVARRDLIALEQRPGIGIGVGGVHRAQKALGEPLLGLILQKSIERTRQNHSSEVPENGAK